MDRCDCYYGRGPPADGKHGRPYSSRPHSEMDLHVHSSVPVQPRGFHASREGLQQQPVCFHSSRRQRPCLQPWFHLAGFCPSLLPYVIRKQLKKIKYLQDSFLIQILDFFFLRKNSSWLWPRNPSALLQTSGLLWLGRTGHWRELAYALCVWVLVLRDHFLDGDWDPQASDRVMLQPTRGVFQHTTG